MRSGRNCWPACTYRTAPRQRYRTACASCTIQGCDSELIATGVVFEVEGLKLVKKLPVPLRYPCSRTSAREPQLYPAIRSAAFTQTLSEKPSSIGCAVVTPGRKRVPAALLPRPPPPGLIRVSGRSEVPLGGQRVRLADTAALVDAGVGLCGDGSGPARQRDFAARTVRMGP